MKSVQAQTRELTAGLLWFGILLGSFLLYSMGLGAGLLFDDQSNLDMLARLKGQLPLYDSLQYALNGPSSALGRPLTLLTFALQYHSWPKHPEDFLRVNVLIHLLNGTLLFWALLKLQKLRCPPHSPLPILTTLGAASLWLILPIQVSTVLYVVQRMTLFSSMFMLSGMVLYLHGRQLGVAGRTFPALLFMSVAMFVGLVLGILAKEVAALFPLMIITLEATLLRDAPQPRFSRWWRPLALYLPLALISVYVLLPANFAAYQHRNFGLGERLLTEPRVLFEYVHTITMPGLSTGRIFFDDFPISHTLLTPVTTLGAIVAWLLLLAAAYRLKRPLPGLSLAVFWFLACHALESTHLPLEIGFEHRNYMASIGLLLGGVLLLTQALESAPLSRLKPALLLLSLAYPAYLLFAAQQSIKLWGQPQVRAVYWNLHQPDSRRAYHTHAEQLTLAGNVEAAVRVYQAASARWPMDVSFITAQITLSCLTPSAAVPSAEELHRVALNSDADVLAVFGGMLNLWELQRIKLCPLRSSDEIANYMNAMDVPLLTQVYPHAVLSLQARAAASNANFASAKDKMWRAVSISPSIPAIQDAVTYALQSGDVPLAKKLIEQAKNDRRISQIHRWSYRLEIQGLQHLLDLYVGSGTQLSTKIASAN